MKMDELRALTTEELEKSLAWWKRECSLMANAPGRERVRCANQVKKLKKVLTERETE